MLKIIKKDGTLQAYDEQKIVNACKLSATRSMDDLDNADYEKICEVILDYIEDKYGDDAEIPVKVMHAIVERVLTELYPNTGKAYRDYRN